MPESVIAGGESLNPMGIREKLSEKPSLAAGAAAIFVLIAAAIAVRSHWPEKKADLDQALYSEDDGQTWFNDSIFRVAPFDHNGKTAVAAQVYSYDDGKKQFCGYLVRFMSDAKAQLDAALADAQRNGQPPGTVSLYQNRNFMNRLEFKLPGPNHPWVRYDDPRSFEIRSVHSPDGSALDQVLVY